MQQRLVPNGRNLPKRDVPNGKGLLLPPEGTGVNSLYNDEHLERILLIKELQNNYMPLSKIRDFIMENPEAKAQSLKNKSKNDTRSKTSKINADNDEQIRNTANSSNSSKENRYIREDVQGIFEIHISEKNYEKYNYIVENVKKYVMKMMED